MIGLSTAVRIALVAGMAWPNLSVASSERAAPWIILIEEEGAGRRTALTDWLENQQLMLSIKKVDPNAPKQVRAAKGLRVAMFWGPTWKDWREKGIDLNTLSLDSADQHARLFRATDADPAYWQSEPFTLRSEMRFIESSGVKVLESHGVSIGPPQR